MPLDEDTRNSTEDLFSITDPTVSYDDSSFAAEDDLSTESSVFENYTFPEMDTYPSEKILQTLPMSKKVLLTTKPPIYSNNFYAKGFNNFIKLSNVVSKTPSMPKKEDIKQNKRKSRRKYKKNFKSAFSLKKNLTFSNRNVKHNWKFQNQNSVLSPINSSSTLIKMPSSSNDSNFHSFNSFDSQTFFDEEENNTRMPELNHEILYLLPGYFSQHKISNETIKSNNEESTTKMTKKSKVFFRNTKVTSPAPNSLSYTTLKAQIVEIANITKNYIDSLSTRFRYHTIVASPPSSETPSYIPAANPSIASPFPSTLYHHVPNLLRSSSYSVSQPSSRLMFLSSHPAYSSSSSGSNSNYQHYSSSSSQSNSHSYSSSSSQSNPPSYSSSALSNSHHSSYSSPHINYPSYSSSSSHSDSFSNSAPSYSSHSSYSSTNIHNKPEFDNLTAINVSAQLGEDVYLGCRVHNLGNQSVSIN